MDQPPPYEHQPLDSTASTPTFHIRQTTPSDAASVRRLDEHMIANSLRATRETAASLAVVKSSILDPSLPNLVQILAVPISQPNTGSSISGLVQKFKNYTVDRPPQKKTEKQRTVDITNKIGILGYAILLPYTDGIKGPTKCYDRTASLFVSSMEESFIGEDLYWNVTRALIDEALERSREQGDDYRTVLASTTFSEDEPTLARWRDVLLDRGFVQAGCLKGVLEKRGKLMDRVYFQRDMDADIVAEPAGLQTDGGGAVSKK